MITNKHTVLTPCGSFDMLWSDDIDDAPMFEGSKAAQDYVEEYLAIKSEYSTQGLLLSLPLLTPADLMRVCNAPDYGILALPDLEDGSAVGLQD